MPVQLPVDTNYLLPWLENEFLRSIFLDGLLGVECVGFMLIVKLELHHFVIVCHTNFADGFSRLYCLVEEQPASKHALLLLGSIIESHTNSTNTLVFLSELNSLKQSTLECFRGRSCCKAVRDYKNKVSFSIILFDCSRLKLVDPVALWHRNLQMVRFLFFYIDSPEFTTFARIFSLFLWE